MDRHLTLVVLLSLTLLIGGCETISTRSSVGYLPANGDDNCKIFTNSIENKTIQWIGQCAEGFVDGYGVADHYVNGYRQITIMGNFAKGKVIGQGRAKYADGEQYLGEFKDGRRHGQGVLFSRNKYTKYEGEFKDGAPNGHGIETYYSRLIGGGKKINKQYVGAFKDGKRNGLGILSSFDGLLRKEGVWANGDFVHSEKVIPPPLKQQTDVAINEEKSKSDSDQQAQSKLPPCTSVDYSKNSHDKRIAKWHNCYGRYVFDLNDSNRGNVYEGDFQYGMYNGWGTITYAGGGKYEGEWKDGERSGKGKSTAYDGRILDEGIWDDDAFIHAEKIKLPTVNLQTDLAINEERKRLTEERNRREQAKQSSKLALQTITTNPDVNGNVTITVRTNADTSSLKVNGEEQGGRPDGNYVIKKVARVGQDTNYVITAVDTNGNTDSTTITVARQAVSQSSNQSASLKPESIKRAPSRDAVAIIIGIQNYKRVPKAEFANNDAKDFYEYAIRGLGIKPENIKLLLDEDAEQVELYKAFQNWLPLQVTKDKTDVYVFYSGHGLPSPDGKSLYLLPQGVDKQFIEKTAVSQQEVIAALVASKPKSVTMFIDACYSGQTRSGEMMIASVRPLAVKSEVSVYPPNFTVISASSNDQYSSSSPELNHGIFSFFLMKGMEGDADGNKDGKITAGEMQEYLSDKVSRQAMSMSRKQDTQLVGDANKVLMGR
jgi:hypothetical protein